MLLSWDTSLKMFYIKTEQNSPRRNKVLLCGGNGIIGCGQWSCRYTIRTMKTLVILQQLRNSYCLIMIVSIGRHEKGQESLRGILKKISESSEVQLYWIECIVPNIHSECFGNTWAAFSGSHAGLLSNVFTITHTQKESHSIKTQFLENQKPIETNNAS